MAQRDPVLVGFDFTDGSEAALQQGFAMARDSHSPLIVGHVLPEAFRTRVLVPHQAGTDADEQALVEQRATAAIIAHLTKTLDVVPEVALETGTPHAGLLSLAGRFKAGLIVVGPGKVAQHMARSAEQPVLVARPSPERGVVLGATDFSDPALPAVRAAAKEAARRQTTLRLLHCLDLDPPARLAHDNVWFSFPELSDEAFASLEQEARARLNAVLAETGRPGESAVIRLPATVGIVASALGTPTSLVVVGTRGRTGLLRLMLGNVAEHVIGHAPCSVLVVPLGNDVASDAATTVRTG